MEQSSDIGIQMLLRFSNFIFVQIAYLKNWLKERCNWMPFHCVLYWTTDSSVLERKGNSDKSNIEKKHGYSKGFVHLPSGANSNAEDNEDQRDEED